MSATSNTKQYDDLLSGEYWELYRIYDYGDDTETWEPIGYTRAGVEFTDDGLDEKEANPSDSGVIQSGYGKSNPGLEFESMTTWHDPDAGDDPPRVKMGLIDANGNGVNAAEWEAAGIRIYDTDPSKVDTLDPKEVAECPGFNINTDSIEFTEDDYGTVSFGATMNAHPRWPMQIGEGVPSLG